MEFSEKIRFARRKLALSQEDLARALNVSFSTINRWENEKSKPIKMAQAAFNNFCENHGINFNENEVNDAD
jgi:DNA-binding transcriptional regulator YiaG